MNMPQDHHANHDHHEHGEHTHVHTETKVKGSQKDFFSIGFLGGIAGLSLIGLSVLVWVIFGQASSLIEVSSQNAEAVDTVGE